MRRVKTISVVVLLLCAVWLINGWGDAPAAYAAEPPGPVNAPTSEIGPIGVDLLPPLPFSKATLDLPSFRIEREAAIAGGGRTIIDITPDFAVAKNGRTSLHLNVNVARAEGEKWIEVNLSDQKLYAWVGDQMVDEFLISTGIGAYPTVQGVFRMWVRTPTQTMSGGSPQLGTYYNLPNVPWVQYFFGEYALHGTYWHSNFGTPMSHGCVNLTIEDAEWLFNWAFPEWDGSMEWTRSNSDNATLVWIHK